MPQAQAVAAIGQELQAGLAEARARSNELFRIVRQEAIYDRPIPERHRIAFYLGHLEAFDWNLICRGGFGMEPIHAEFDKLFAFGIDPVGGGLPTDRPGDWPRLEQILQYNQRVQEGVDGCLRTFAAHGARDPQHQQLFHVAIEHRLMHAETLAYMLHRLPLNRKVAGPSPLVVNGAGFKARMVEIATGAATMGLPRSGRAFGWDNEFEQNTVSVPAFSIDTHNVTNGQWLDFLLAGGYTERGLWSDADWEWRTKQTIVQPAFWKNVGGQWRYRAMFDEVPLPLDWPVYVSHAEASAYARWVGKALPTEAQFHRAAYGTPDGRELMYPWGDAAPDSRRGSFDFAGWDPAPVGAFPAGNSAFGVADLLGNGWEWTSTSFGPFPGFEPFPFYRGYSADFFDATHSVMKGGSMRTASRLLRASFRNWFQPHYPYVYAKFRCVEN